MKLEKIAELNEGYGAKLAYSPRGTWWTSVAHVQFHLWQEQSHVKAVDFREAAGAVAFRGDERELLISPLRYDLEAGIFVTLPPLAPALSAGIAPEMGARSEQFEVGGAAWNPAGNKLVVYTQYRALRRIGASASYSGPARRVLLIDGPTRALDKILWEGSSAEEYRQIAVSAGHIAAGAQTIQLWDATGMPRKPLSAHTMNLRDLRFDAAGARLLSADWSGRVILWSIPDGHILADWMVHDGPTRSAVFHPRLPIAATGGEDARLNLFTLDAGKTPTRALSEPLPGPVDSIAFHPDGERLIVAVSTGVMFVYALRQP